MRDIFICHASEDKQQVVEPIVNAFKQANISYWYDKAEIRWGDLITNKVNDGLKISRFVIVVLSKSFLNKGFPKHELYSVLNTEIYSQEVKILPLIAASNQEDKQDILNELPLLQGKAYQTWDGNTDKIISALSDILYSPIEQSSMKQTTDINKYKLQLSSIDRVHNSILEEFNLDTAKKIIETFVTSSDERMPYITFLEQTVKNKKKDVAAIRGEAGSGKSLVAKATYVYLNHILKTENNDIKPYYINWLWTVEKDLAMNEYCYNKVNEIKNSIEEFINTIRQKNKVILIVDGLDRYNPFAQEFLQKIINRRTDFLIYKCILCERIYPPTDDYNKAIRDDRLIRQNPFINYKYNIKYILDNKKDALCQLLTNILDGISEIEKVSNALSLCKEWYSDSNNIRLIHLLAKDELQKQRSADVLKRIFINYVSENKLEIQNHEVTADCIFEDAEKYAYDNLFITAKEVKEETLPKDSKSLYIKRLSTQSIEMRCYLAASYIFRVLFIDKNFSTNVLAKFEKEKLYPKLFNKYVKEFIENSLEQDNILKTIKDNYDSCGIRLKSFLAYICGRFVDIPIRKEAKKFLSEKNRILQTNLNNEEENSEIFILERTINISLIFLDNSAINYIEELINNPYKDSINRSFHLSYYGDLNSFSRDINILYDNLDVRFTKTFKALSKNIENYLNGVNKRNKGVCELSIYTLYSLVLSRYQNGTLDNTISKDKIINFAEQVILPYRLKLNAKITDYVFNCLDYLKSGEKPLLQIFYWILKLKTHRRSGWNEGYREDITRKVSDPESVMGHIASAAILATTFLPEKINLYTYDNNREKYEKYDKNEIIRLILMHDIGEYEFGDIPKPLRREEDRQKEKKAVDRLNMVGSIMNSEQLRSVGNPQETICKYWYRFATNQLLDINVIIAHEIDVLECLIQLHKYNKEDNNIISDFESFKSSLENRINTPIVDSIAKLLLGEKNYK